jgi:hypothetical protein
LLDSASIESPFDIHSYASEFLTCIVTAISVSFVAEIQQTPILQFSVLRLRLDAVLRLLSRAAWRWNSLIRLWAQVVGSAHNRCGLTELQLSLELVRRLVAGRFLARRRWWVYSFCFSQAFGPVSPSLFASA